MLGQHAVDVSGRVKALVVDPRNSNVVYLGAAQGGVWKTTNGGDSWTPLTDDQPSLAMGALAGLRTMVQQLPEEVRPVFYQAVDQVVVQDGFGCVPEVLHALQPAIAEGRRVVIVMEGGEGEERLSVDPKRLFLRDGILFLEAAGIEPDASALVALTRVRKVILTPFYSPTD